MWTYNKYMWNNKQIYVKQKQITYNKYMWNKNKYTSTVFELYIYTSTVTSFIYPTVHLKSICNSITGTKRTLNVHHQIFPKARTQKHFFDIKYASAIMWTVEKRICKYQFSESIKLQIFFSETNWLFWEYTSTVYHAKIHTYTEPVLPHPSVLPIRRSPPQISILPTPISKISKVNSTVVIFSST